MAASILCFAIHSHADTKTLEAIEKSFDWVVADRSELQRTTIDRLRKETHYPKELEADDYQLSEKRRGIERRIATLEKQESDKCEKQVNSKSKSETPTEQGESHSVNRLNKEFHECYDNVSELKEHQTLTSQKNELNSLSQKRRAFEEGFRKKADEILESVMSTYSKENNIMLIVNSRSDAIMYNKNLVVLDVTQKIKAIINNKKSLMN